MTRIKNLSKLHKKSAIELNFQFFLGIIIVIAVLLLGYKGIEALVSFSNENVMIQLRSDLTGSYKRAIDLGRGSSFNQTISAPTGFICFYDPHAKGSLDMLKHYQAALDEETNNVFLLVSGRLTPLMRMNLNQESMEKCFESSGSVTLSFESFGDSVRIK